MAARSRRQRAHSRAAQAVLDAVEILPRLGAEIGFAVAGQADGKVEILPGSPAALAFISRGRLQGLVMAPMSEDALRRVIGLSVTPRDRAADLLWELDRRDPTTNLPT